MQTPPPTETFFREMDLRNAYPGSSAHMQRLFDTLGYWMVVELSMRAILVNQDISEVYLGVPLETVVRPLLLLELLGGKLLFSGYLQRSAAGKIVDSDFKEFPDCIAPHHPDDDGWGV